jgi:adenylate cyclase
MHRRLAAIMVGDIVGYSKLMEAAEERTAARLDTCQSIVSEKVGLLGGRVFNTAGDSVLAEFPSAINAVRCAVEIRIALAGANLPDDEPITMRFGLHLADVMVRGNDLIGNGVNIAARIEQSADPGSICISDVLYAHIRRNSPYIFEDLGDKRFKNITEPIHLYRVRGEMGGHRLQSAPTRPSSKSERRAFSIAILPFRATGSDEGQRFFAEGLTEELIVELGRFRRLSVSSRSASFAVDDIRADPIRVGDALSVCYVLEGQVRKVANRISISLILSDTVSGSIIWSQKIARRTDELFDVLDETAAKIAATVVGRVEDVTMVAARRKLPENMTAFECLLRGIDYHRLGGVTDDNAREAVMWFSRAIEADPNYAAAYAWRVCAASWLSDFDYEIGERDIRRALELDSNDPEATRILGVFELLKDNYEQAAACSERAMELNPSDAYIKARSASVSTYVGKPERSLQLLDEAESLDPFLPVWCIEERGVALYALERFRDAIQALGNLMFQTYRARLYRAAAYVALDDLESARRAVREALAGQPGLTVSGFMMKERYRDLEKRRELSQRLEVAGLPASPTLRPQ